MKRVSFPEPNVFLSKFVLRYEHHFADFLPELHGVSPSKVNISSVFEFDGVIIAAKLVSFESASIYHRWRSSCQVSFARKLVGVCRFFCLMSIILILVAAGALSMSYPTCFRSSNPRKYALKAFNHIQMHGR